MSKEITKAEQSIVQRIKNEINRELADPETLKSLLDTTFKGLDAQMMKRAILEGMLRGFPFIAFLKKEVYAIPFAGGYTIITSIDYSRKIGQKNAVWQSKPEFEVEGNKVVSCTVIAYKRIGTDIAEYPATVYFAEYSTGKNLWNSKPRTMLAKVAEMHALRKACPEELAQTYAEEEIQKQEPVRVAALDVEALKAHEQTLLEIKDLESLDRYWADLPVEYKTKLKNIYEGQRAILVEEAKDIV